MDDSWDQINEWLEGWMNEVMNEWMKDTRWMNKSIYDMMRL